MEEYLNAGLNLIDIEDNEVQRNHNFFSVIDNSSKTVYGDLRQEDYLKLDDDTYQLLDEPEVKIKLRNIATGEIMEYKRPITNTVEIPLVFSEYCEILGMGDEYLTLKKFDAPNHTIRNDIRLPVGELMHQLILEMEKTELNDVFCTVINVFGQNHVVSVRSCSSFPDIQRLPSEMKEKIFSFLPVPDILSLRRVCLDWNSYFPIESIIQLQRIKICSGRIVSRLEFVEQARNVLPGWKTVAPGNLAKFGPALLSTTKCLELRERVNDGDLKLIVEHCKNIDTIDMDYPTDAEMKTLSIIVENNEKTLQKYSLWDYFWYNSVVDALDCGIFSKCLSLHSLTLFVKYITNLELLPLQINCLKLDKLSASQIIWIHNNMINLKFLRFEAIHNHWHVMSNAEACGVMTKKILKGLLNMPKIERLDLSFSTLPSAEHQPVQAQVLCPEVQGFERMCNAMEKVEAYSDTWDSSCTLEVLISH